MERATGIHSQIAALQNELASLGRLGTAQTTSVDPPRPVKRRRGPTPDESTQITQLAELISDSSTTSTAQREMAEQIVIDCFPLDIKHQGSAPSTSVAPSAHHDLCVVVDTSVFLADVGIVSTLLDIWRVQVSIPRAVLFELDGLKKGDNHGDTSHKARHAIRVINDLLESQHHGLLLQDRTDTPVPRVFFSFICLLPLSGFARTRLIHAPPLPIRSVCRHCASIPTTRTLSAGQ